MTFLDLAYKYLAARGPLGQAERTRISYAETFGLFSAFLTAQGLKDDVRHFTSENVAAFRDWFLARTVRGKRVKASSAGTRLAALSSLGKWASMVERPAKERLPANPALTVERPRAVRPPEKFLYREEVAALQSVPCAPNERLVLDAFFATGARVSGLAGAQVQNLQPVADGLALTIRLKGGRPQTIPLGPDLSERLTQSIREREAGPAQPVFVNQRGEKYRQSSLSELVFRLGQRAGITRLAVRPHVLRHTYNTYARLDAKLDIVKRANLLGHSGTRTLSVYEHSLPEEEIQDRSGVRAVFERMSQPAPVSVCRNITPSLGLSASLGNR